MPDEARDLLREAACLRDKGENNRRVKEGDNKKKRDGGIKKRTYP